MADRITHYDIGARWTPKATFTDAAGTAGDPATLTVRQQTAAGVETIILNSSNPGTLLTGSTPVARISAGVYQLNPGITLDQAGYWFVRFEAPGVADERQAIVDPSEFTADSGLAAYALVTIPETKAWLAQNQINNADDLVLANLINAASIDAMNISDREFKTTDPPATIRTFDLDPTDWNYPLGPTIDIGDLATFTSASLVSYNQDGTTATTTALKNVVPQPRIRGTWEPIEQLRLPPATSWASSYSALIVTGTWGFPSVPANVKQAVLEAIGTQYDRDVEHYRQDLGTPQQAEAGTTVNIGQSGNQILSWPPRAFAVMLGYRNMVLA